MYTRKVYQEISSLLLAIENCKKSGNKEWLDKHSERLDSLVAYLMPRGYGFDNGTHLDESSTPEKIVFNTAFHHRDENGFYCGWSEHSIIVTPSLFSGFDIRVTGRDRRDIKEYIAEEFQNCLDLDSSDPWPRRMTAEDYATL